MPTSRGGPQTELRVLMVLFVVACSGRMETDPVSRATLQPRAFVVASTLLPTIKVLADRLVFPAGVIEQEGWQAGDILAGDFVEGSVDNPYGFLRRLTAIEHSEGTTVAHTEQASLTDAVLEGTLRQSLQLVGASSRSVTRRARVGRTEQALGEYERLTFGPVGNQTVAVSFDVPNTNLGVVGEFGVTDMSAAIGAGIELEFMIARSSLGVARIVVNSDAALELDPMVRIGVQREEKTKIRDRLDLYSLLSSAPAAPFEYKTPQLRSLPRTVYWGGLPVVVSLVAQGVVKCTLELSAKFEAGAALTLSVSESAGIRYADGHIEPIFTGRAEHNGKTSFGGSAGGALRCGLDLNFGLEFYGLATTYFILTPYADVESTFASTCEGNQFEPLVSGATDLKYGLRSSVSFEPGIPIKVLGLDLTGVSVPMWDLFGPEFVPLAETPTPSGGDHCPCGARNQPCCDPATVEGPPCDAPLVCEEDSTCGATAGLDNDGGLDDLDGGGGHGGNGDGGGPSGEDGGVLRDDDAGIARTDGGNAYGPPSPPSGSAQLLADPHLRTFDGLRYDMQAVGELTVVRDPSDGFEVQIRTRPYTVFIPASVTIAVAARVGANRVGVYLDGNVRLNGVSFTPVLGRNELPGEGTLYRLGERIVLVWPDNSQLHVIRHHPAFFDVTVFVPDGRKGKVAGLLGNFDGTALGELRSREGTPLAEPASFENFYRVLVESWRVTPENSLFDYAPGEGPETFADRSFPPGQAGLDELTAGVRVSAEAACRAASVSEGWLESCVLDVGITGDASFAQAFLMAPAPVAELAIQVPRATSGINLADMIGGGDGSGNGASQGIDILTGGIATAHAQPIRCPVNTFVPSTNPYVDGVFCPDGDPAGAAVVPISTTGLTITGLPDWSASLNAGSTWDHLWNGLNSGVTTTLSGQILGAHANKGVTFDLSAIEAANNHRQIARFAVGAAFGATRPPAAEPDVGFIVVIDGVKQIEYLGPPAFDSSIPILIPISPEARFLTLITASVGDMANDWAFWLEPRLFLAGSPDIFEFLVAPESMDVSHVTDDGLGSDLTPDGVFLVELRGPVSALVLYSADANGNASGHQWDTSVGALPEATGAPWLDAAGTFFLGVEEDGRPLHPTDGNFAILDSGVHRLRVYAQDTGVFGKGRYFRLASVSGGKAVSLSPLLKY